MNNREYQICTNCVMDTTAPKIIFDKNVNNGNSPIYLDLFKLERAKFDGYWFARKVKKDVALTWLDELT